MPESVRIADPMKEVKEEDTTNAAENTADAFPSNFETGSTEEEYDKADMITRNALAAWLDHDEHDVEPPDVE